MFVLCGCSAKFSRASGRASSPTGHPLIEDHEPLGQQRFLIPAARRDRARGAFGHVSCVPHSITTGGPIQPRGLPPIDHAGAAGLSAPGPGTHASKHAGIRRKTPARDATPLHRCWFLHSSASSDTRDRWGTDRLVRGVGRFHDGRYEREAIGVAGRLATVGLEPVGAGQKAGGLPRLGGAVRLTPGDIHAVGDRWHTGGGETSSGVRSSPATLIVTRSGSSPERGSYPYPRGRDHVVIVDRSGN